MLAGLPGRAAPRAALTPPPPPLPLSSRMVKDEDYPTADPYLVVTPDMKVR